MNFSSQLGFIFLLLALVLLALFGLIRLCAWLGARTETTLRRRAERRLRDIESRLDEFVRQRITAEAPAAPPDDLDRLTGDALVALEGPIESFVSMWNPAAPQAFRHPLESHRFRKTLARLETLLNRPADTDEPRPFAETDLQSLRNAFRSDVRAELESRILEMKMKNAPTR
jgi:PAS domain-containing protein